MRLLDLSTKSYHTLFEHLEQSGRLVHEVDAQGWAPFLDRTDLLGSFFLLAQLPAPCCAGLPLRTAGMAQQAFRTAPPVEYFEDPLSMSGPKLEFDLRDSTVRSALLAQTKTPPEALVPNLWQFGTPCTTFCDYQQLNGGTRTTLCPEGDGTRADEVQGNDFAAFAAEACMNLHASGRLFAFESSAPSGRYPKIWDLPCMQKLREQTGARLVPLHMRAWHLQSWDCAPGVFHKKPTWWLVSAELFPWVHLFLSRHCPGVSTDHQHVQLGGPSHLSGVPATRVAQQYTVPLRAAWGLAVRAAFEQWDWRRYLAGRCSIHALSLYQQRTRAPGRPPVDFCDPTRFFPRPPSLEWVQRLASCMRTAQGRGSRPPRSPRPRRTCLML